MTRLAPLWYPKFLRIVAYTIDYMGLVPVLNVFAAAIEVFLGIFFGLTLPLFGILYWFFGEQYDLQSWFWCGCYGRKAISLKEQYDPSDPVMYKIKGKEDVLWYCCFIPLYCFGNALSDLFFLKYIFYPIIMYQEGQIRMVSFDFFTFAAFSIIAGVPWHEEDLAVE